MRLLNTLSLAYIGLFFIWIIGTSTLVWTRNMRHEKCLPLWRMEKIVYDVYNFIHALLNKTDVWYCDHYQITVRVYGKFYIPSRRTYVSLGFIMDIEFIWVPEMKWYEWEGSLLYKDKNFNHNCLKRNANADGNYRQEIVCLNSFMGWPVQYESVHIHNDLCRYSNLILFCFLTTTSIQFVFDILS